MRSILFAVRRGSARLAMSAALLVGLVACTHAPAQPAQLDDLVPALEHLVMDTAAAAPQAPAVLLHVHGPRRPLVWHGSAGPAAGKAGTHGPSLRIASNTKTFIAAAVLRLVEDGRLNLDAPLAEVSPQGLSHGFMLGVLDREQQVANGLGALQGVFGQANAECAFGAQQQLGARQAVESEVAVQPAGRRHRWQAGRPGMPLAQRAVDQRLHRMQVHAGGRHRRRLHANVGAAVEVFLLRLHRATPWITAYRRRPRGR
jgi:CubicO group peptidase (beta-lactamase class C family)